MLYEFVAGPLPFGSESDDQYTLFYERCVVFFVFKFETYPEIHFDNHQICLLTRLELFREILEHEITFMNYVTDQPAKVSPVFKIFETLLIFEAFKIIKCSRNICFNYVN